MIYYFPLLKPSALCLNRKRTSCIYSILHKFNFKIVFDATRLFSLSV